MLHFLVLQHHILADGFPIFRAHPVLEDIEDEVGHVEVLGLVVENYTAEGQG